MHRAPVPDALAPLQPAGEWKQLLANLEINRPDIQLKARQPRMWLCRAGAAAAAFGPVLPAGTGTDTWERGGRVGGAGVG